MSSFLDFLKPTDPTGVASEVPDEQPAEQGTTDPNAMNAPKAYGFGTADTSGGETTSKFDRMRRQQLGAGGSSQGG